MQEELSDFLKIAYKYNRVKNLKEAFEEFPVEEEWHKGKIQNVLEEDSETLYKAQTTGSLEELVKIFEKCQKRLDEKLKSCIPTINQVSNEVDLN